MPNSYKTGKRQIRQWFLDNIPIESRIIDVGPGRGTYYDLLNDIYDNIDAIEIYKPYVEKYKLELKYNKVWVMDVVDFRFSKTHYDVAIFGDVIEHLGVSDARKVLNQCTNEGIIAMVAIPYQYKQIGKKNINETHLQDDLTDEIFLRRCPDFESIFVYPKYGYYSNIDWIK